MARPVGATTRPQFYTYITEVERKAFVKWIVKNYKKDKELAKWYGDQMFGKATQTLASDPDNPLIVQFDSSFKNVTTRKTKTDSTKSS